MTLLVISPDYASHLYPLATLATAWREAGERVVVASGPATAGLVATFGYEREQLQLGRGSNPGVIRAEEQPPGEDDSLRGFFEATRRGAVETLAYQARARGEDLLWNAVGVAHAVHDVVDRVRPDTIIVDHLAFGARIGLTSAGIRHADVVLGHPSALTVGDEVYGYPPAWPRAITPDPAELDELRLTVGAGARRLHGPVECRPRSAVARRHPQRRRVRRDRRRPAAQLPAGAARARAHLAPAAPHLPRVRGPGRGARRRRSSSGWPVGDEPIVYVSLGSFLSARDDVLARIADALRGLDVRVALAHGSTPRAVLGSVPSTWLVREVLPQVTLLRRASLAISHGGNNSVTEALTAGVPFAAAPPVHRPVRRRCGGRASRARRGARPQRSRRRPDPRGGPAPARPCRTRDSRRSPRRRFPG